MLSGLKTPAILTLAAALTLPSVAFAQVPPPPTGNAPAAAPAPAPAPAPVNTETMTEDEKMDMAKGMYVQAEGLAANGDMTSATPLYEQAYNLVPGKHGFAYKVGIAAYGSTPRDCVKSDEYLRHYVRYGDAAKHADWMDEAKRILGEIAVSGCGVSAAAPAPVPAETSEPEGPVGGDEPTFTSREDERNAAAEDERRERDSDETPGALKGGIALAVVGGLALVGGGVTLGLANGKANSLADLSSSSISNTSTGFPTGDYDCRVPGQECAEELEGQLKTLNLTSASLLIGGGVLVAVGGTLIAVGMIKKKKSRSAMVVPAIGPRTAGATASFKF